MLSNQEGGRGTKQHHRSTAVLHKGNNPENFAGNSLTSGASRAILLPAVPPNAVPSASAAAILLLGEVWGGWWWWCVCVGGGGGGGGGMDSRKGEKFCITSSHIKASNESGVIGHKVQDSEGEQKRAKKTKKKSITNNFKHNIIN